LAVGKVQGELMGFGLAKLLPPVFPRPITPPIEADEIASIYGTVLRLAEFKRLYWIGNPGLSWKTYVSGSGVVGANDTFSGFLLNTGTTAGSYVEARGWASYGRVGLEDRIVLYASSVWLAYPKANEEWAITYGSAGIGTAPKTGFFGFRQIGGSVYATNWDGVAEKRTLIATIPSTRYEWEMNIVAIRFPERIDYYLNGELKASHTENLPSGDPLYPFVVVTHNRSVAEAKYISLRTGGYFRW